jgi:hypothetical protein
LLEDGVDYESFSDGRLIVGGYDGIDVNITEGSYIVCRSRRCRGRTVLGRLTQGEFMAGGPVPFTGDGTRTLVRSKRPKTSRRRAVLGPAEPYTPGRKPWFDETFFIPSRADGRSVRTGIKLTERVRCWKCGWLLSLRYLTASDLRRVPARGPE